MHHNYAPSQNNGRRLPGFLLAALLLTGCESSPPPAPPTETSAGIQPQPCSLPEPLPAPWFPADKTGVTPGEGVKKIDFSTFLVRPEHSNDLTLRLNQLADAGVGQVRFDTAWNRIEPEPCKYDWSMVDPWMEGLAQRQITALMIAGKVPKWATDTPDCNSEGKCPPRNPDDYGRFAAALATRYKHFKADIELGNEVKNIPPDVYARMCGNAYTRIKQASPESLVLFGSKAPTDPRRPDDPESPVNFFRAVDAVRDEAGKSMCNWDIMSVHPYTDPINGRVKAGEDDRANGMGRMYELDDAMEAANYTTRPIWITEFGSTTEQLPQLDALLNRIKDNRLVTKVFWFTLRDDPANSSYYGAINAEGRPREVFDAIKRYNQG